MECPGSKESQELREHIISLEFQLNNIKDSFQKLDHELERLDKSFELLSSKKPDWMQISMICVPIFLAIGSGVLSMSSQLTLVDTSIKTMSSNLSEYKLLSKEDMRRIEKRLEELENKEKERWKRKE